MKLPREILDVGLAHGFGCLNASLRWVDGRRVEVEALRRLAVVAHRSVVVAFRRLEDIGLAHSPCCSAVGARLDCAASVADSPRLHIETCRAAVAVAVDNCPIPEEMSY